jgi:hypothetical protein
LDRELFADLFTAYYTDMEPSSTFVAWVESTFAGYVLTALDTRTHVQVWRAHILLPALCRVLTKRYRLPFSTLPQLFRLGIAFASWKDLKMHVAEYPGHLHINIVDQYRRSPSVARMLLHRAVQHFRDNGVSAIHGIVMTSRTRMVKKYEHLGFKVLARHPAPRPSPRGRGTPHWLLLAMKLDAINDRPFSTQSLRNRKRTGSLAGDHADC